MSHQKIRCHSFQFAGMVGAAVVDLEGMDGAYKVRQSLSDIYAERIAERAAAKAALNSRGIRVSGTGAPVTTGSKSHYETNLPQNSPGFPGQSS